MVVGFCVSLGFGLIRSLPPKSLTKLGWNIGKAFNFWECSLGSPKEVSFFMRILATEAFICEGLGLFCSDHDQCCLLGMQGQGMLCVFSKGEQILKEGLSEGFGRGSHSSRTTFSTAVVNQVFSWCCVKRYTKFVLLSSRYMWVQCVSAMQVWTHVQALKKKSKRICLIHCAGECIPLIKASNCQFLFNFLG